MEAGIAVEGGHAPIVPEARPGFNQTLTNSWWLTADRYPTDLVQGETVMPGVMWLLFGAMVFGTGMLIGARLVEVNVVARERRIAQQRREIAEQWQELKNRARVIDVDLQGVSYFDDLLRTAHVRKSVM